MICYSTPAKTILSGEHSVVYGKPALASALNLRLRFFLWQGKGKEDKIIKYIAAKTKNFLKKKAIPFADRPFDFKIKSDIPIGKGLGSSAALAVASAAAFLEFYSGEKQGREMINNLAFQIEKYFHQNPSGIDNSTVCFGGLIYYRKEFEFLKTISRLNFKIPRKIEERLYLIDSGQPEESTAEMVKLVGKEYNRNPKRIGEILSLLERWTKRMVVAIIKEDRGFFKKALEENQQLLEKLGVVSKRAKTIIKGLSRFGRGKITGAGGRKKGSGLILFYQENQEKSDFLAYLKENNLRSIKFTPTDQGIVKEK